MPGVFSDMASYRDKWYVPDDKDTASAGHYRLRPTLEDYKNTQHGRTENTKLWQLEVVRMQYNWRLQ